MSWMGLAAAAAIMIPTQPSAPPDRALVGLRPEAPASAEISVLTYNVKGLPWPIAIGRARALRRIGRELAAMRETGRQPDVVLIQEGFRGEVADLVQASGYRYWAQGPKRGDPHLRRAKGGRPWRSVKYPLQGEGWGKFTGSGLHVLSDLPISRVETAVYRHCAGFDCLASKGMMLVRLDLPGGQAVEVINTHLNSRAQSGVPGPRTLKAHNLQTDELLQFLAERHETSWPLLIGGDFNVRNAPERYDYEAAARPYKVVAEFCVQQAAGCQGPAYPAQARPWLLSQDLQAFRGALTAEVRPMAVENLVVAPDGKPLSDHQGYLVRYRIDWSAAPADRRASEPAPPGRVEHAELAP